MNDKFCIWLTKRKQLMNTISFYARTLIISIIINFPSVYIFQIMIRAQLLN